MDKYVGRQDCPCRPIEKCEWVLGLQRRNDELPNRNRLHKKVLQLIRDSVCKYSSRTVHCCDDRTYYDDAQVTDLLQRKPSVITQNILLLYAESFLDFILQPK